MTPRSSTRDREILVNRIVTLLFVLMLFSGSAVEGSVPGRATGTGLEHVQGGIGCCRLAE